MSISKRLAPMLVIFSLIYIGTVFVAILFVHNFLVGNITEQYSSSLYFKLDSFAEEFNRMATDYQSKTHNIEFEIEDTKKDFYAVGEMDKTALTVKLFVGETQKTYTVTSPVAANLSDNDINYYSFSEILISQDANDAVANDQTRLLVFRYTTQQSTKLGFVDASKFAMMEDSGFLTYGLMFDSTKIAVSDKSESLGKRFEEIFGTYTPDIILDSEYNGQNSYIFTQTYSLKDSTTTSFTCFGVVDASLPAAFEAKVLSREIAVMVSVMVISVVFIILCCWLFIKEYKNITAAGDDRYLVVKTDSEYNILKSNKTFKRLYPTAKYLSLVYVNPEKRSGNLFCFEVKDASQNSNYLTLLLSKGLNTMTFVGVENTSVIKEIGVGFKKVRINDDTYLPNEQVLREDISRMKVDFVIGVIRNLNMETFDVMFGHDFHDQLLKMVAKRMSNLFKRIGGAYYVSSENSFVVMVDTVTHSDFVKEIPHYMAEINKPIEVNGNLVRVESKGGFAICDQMMTDHSFENVIYYCEAAYEKALESKEVLYYAYHESQRKYYQNYLTRDVNIKTLIENNSIMVYYQPQYNEQQHRIIGVEALMRTKPIENFNLSIMQIVQIAEKTGCMILLSDFIYDQGFKTAKELESYNVSVSLNISPIQLMQAGFVDDFLKKYNKYNLKHGSICLEVTESYLMSNFDDTIKKLNILRDNGINIHLDDFGMVYSSLLYLKKLPISTIKIDKEFVGDMETNQYSRTIINNVLDICKSLKLTSIAEGVETAKQKDELFAMGIDTIQGYYVSKAVNRETIISLVKSQKEKKNDAD